MVAPVDTLGDVASHSVRHVRFRVAGWVVLAVTLALNVASMAVPALIDHPLTRDRGEVQLYLDVFVEGNLPTWWSTALLVTGAVVHAGIGAVARARRVPGGWAWFVSAAMLGALSLDDHTQLHERLDRVGREFLSFDGFPFYWLIPGLVAGAFVALALLLLAVRLRGAARWYMVGGCALLLGSALGGEALQGLLIAGGESGPLYVLTYHAEELGENLGVLLMLAATARSLSVVREAGRIGVEYVQHPGPR
ncbi:hypothetical protein CFN78_26620 [Amycolatopsis antarctica]|uniref:DUF998 domain-containing protein n=1 Tax=Amycolatopsis antarctica TaxID=1854586 RepID=A0A263CW05_9PSEU|nr:hypothetical protein [Amycolatopsis antarctica]OZM70149.1 hypothetical protein CFN78_26620 [Amycolatopsis antarctica]